MCWNFEWARAYSNIGWALLHVDRAQAKMDKRTQDRADPKVATRWEKATEENEEITTVLKECQEKLEALIKKYGITRGGDSKTLAKLKKGGINKAVSTEKWLKKN